MRVLVRRDNAARIDLQPFREAAGEIGGIRRRGVANIRLLSEQSGVAPHRFPIRAPKTVESPAGELFAGILFAHDVLQAAPEVQRFIRRRMSWSAWARLVGRPLRCSTRGVEVGGGNERRLPTHRQAHVAAGE